MAFEITFKTKLPRRLLERLNAYVDHTKEACAMILLEETQDAVVKARTYCSVKTGYMQSQIRIEEFNPQELYIIAGVYTNYAAFVEWGTSKMHARPFWCPAIWESWFRIMERMRRLETEIYG